MMVVVVVLMVMVIILRVGDVFVNCDRRFGGWWTRRFLPVCVGPWDQAKNYHQTVIILSMICKLTVKIVPSARPSSSSPPSVSVISGTVA
jgi:hypothetical protein